MRNSELTNIPANQRTARLLSLNIQNVNKNACKIAEVHTFNQETLKN